MTASFRSRSGFFPCADREFDEIIVLLSVPPESRFFLLGIMNIIPKKNGKECVFDWIWHMYSCRFVRIVNLTVVKLYTSRERGGWSSTYFDTTHVGNETGLIFGKRWVLIYRFPIKLVANVERQVVVRLKIRRLASHCRQLLKTFNW